MICEAHFRLKKNGEAKMSNAISRKIWINNEVINKRIDFDQKIPEGFVRGRISFR